MKTILPFLASLLSISCSHATRTPREPVTGEAHVVVMTYNVNYGLAGDEPTMKAIREGGADVVFLQETTQAWEDLLRADLGKIYPHMAFKHCCGAGGLAVLSKLPFEEKEYIPPETWFPAWRIVAQTPIGEMQVLNVHLRPGFGDKGSLVSGYFTTPKMRQKEIGAFYPYLDPALPTLVVGDFNENEGGKAVAFLKEKGFRSALPEFAPKAKTWRWTTRAGNVQARLDHLVYDAKLDPLKVEVRNEGRSDHLPVVAVFKTAAATE